MSFIIQGGSPPWTLINASFVAAGGNVITTTGIRIWNPPFNCFVRGFSLNDDVADPLVPAGGATTLQIRSGAGTTITFISNIGHAVYGVQLNGWGANGPSLSNISGGVGTSDSGVVLSVDGGIPGRPAIANNGIFAQSNAGTYSGTLRFRFEMRPFGGAWT